MIDSSFLSFSDNPINDRINVEIATPLPLGLTTFKGFNLTWIVTHLGDGFFDGWTDRYDQTDLINRLSLLQASGIKYLRFWLSFEYYFNGDKLTAGFTAFNSTFLSNLDNFINVVLPAVNMQALVTISDAPYGSFLPTWTVASSSFRTSYLNAFQTIISRYAGNTNVWGWDMANEPLPAQDGTTRADLISFFNSVYSSGKATNPSHYFSIGSNALDFGFDNACDFYQDHYYPNDGSLPRNAANLTKPIIVGEGGQGGQNAAGTAIMRIMFINAIKQGYCLVMPYDANYFATEPTSEGASTYVASNATLAMIRRITQPTAGVVNI